MMLTEAEREERRRVSRRKWYEKNKEAILIRQKAYQKARPESLRQIQKRWRDRNRESERIRAQAKNWRVQGCPEPTRPQPDHCECCGRRDRKALALDHCHATGAFRGWLCSRCNLAIGKLGDTVEAVQKALDYLKRAQQ